MTPSKLQRRIEELEFELRRLKTAREVLEEFSGTVEKKRKTLDDHARALGNGQGLGPAEIHAAAAANGNGHKAAFDKKQYQRDWRAKKKAKLAGDVTAKFDTSRYDAIDWGADSGKLSNA